MATLNGVEFGILKKTTTVIHDNNVIDIPGSDTVVNDDAGYSTGPMQITGHVKNESEFDDFKGEFYGGGELTLIADPDSGTQYTVYASGNVTELDGDDTYPLTDIVFRCVFLMKYPYIESVADVTKTKTITSNNQEWSADDGGSDIKTEGNVSAVPDIQVTSDMTPLGIISEYNSPGGTPEGLAWDGTNMWSSDFGDSEIYKHNSDMTIHTTYNSPGNGVRSLAWDGTNMWSIDSDDNKIYKHNSDMTVNNSYNTPSTAPHALAWDGSRIWSSDIGLNKIYKHNVDLTVDTTYDSPDTSPTGLMWDGTNIWSSDPNSDKIYKHNSDITVYSEYGTTGSISGLGWDGTNIWMGETTNNKIFKLCGVDCTLSDIRIYNTSDTTVKCNVASDMLAGAIHRINSDGTGTINYTDDFTTQKWYGKVTELNATHDEVDNELDIADDGYVYWEIDTNLPVNGIPILTSRTNITTGIPTIQISINGTTWYDIDTAIVDDVDTEYPLDSDGNLSLEGETLLYFRFDCVKAAAATCSIKSFELDINIHTIYAKNPIINKGATASTFRCDQDSDSSMNCEVKIIYPARWWA